MPFSEYFLRWALAFLFTQTVEIPIYRRTLHPSFWVAFGASAITHPLLWLYFAFPIWHAPYTLTVAIAEVLVWLVEAAYFRWIFGCKRAILWAFVANAASFTLGLISNALFGVPG